MENQSFTPNYKYRKRATTKFVASEVEGAHLLAPPPSMAVSRSEQRRLEIMRRVALGEKNVHIAKDMGLTQSTVSIHKCKPESREDLKNIQAAAIVGTVDLITTINNNAPAAYEVLMDMMHDVNTPETERAKIALDNLDRAGLSAPKKILTANISGRLTNDDIAKIKQNAANAGTLAGSVREI